MEKAIEQMRELGAIIIDNADIPTAQLMSESDNEMTVLLFEFKANLNIYLTELTETPVHSLADIIEFNKVHAEEELSLFGRRKC